MFLTYRVFILLTFFINNFFITNKLLAASCNGGVDVSSSLTVSASCDGGGSAPLKLNTGANVTINSGVTVSNSAGFSRNGDPIWINTGATSSTINNNGTIYTALQWGITVNSGATLTNLNNNGTISSGFRRGIVNNGGTITNIDNLGSIVGPFASITEITANQNIQKLNNLQGAGNSNGAITYNGPLPIQYNIIINSNSVYGKLSGGTGITTFGIDSRSVVSVGTYDNVLTGVTFSNLLSLTGTYGAYNWTLVPDGTNYDLTITASRLAYNQTVTSSKLSKTATLLETIRTNGTKTTLTNTLDSLTSAQLETAIKKYKG